MFFLNTFVSLPSQIIEQFSMFKERWEEAIIIINNINNCFPTVAMYIGDFSARIDGMMEWWNGDSTNLQGTELAELAAQYSLK